MKLDCVCFIAGISDSSFSEFIDSSKMTVGKSLLIAFVLNDEKLLLSG